MQPIWHWLTQANTVQDVVTKALVTVIAAGVVYVLATSFKTLKKSLGKWRGRKKLFRQILRYRERLDHDTFRIHHSWMKEGQTLEDILVPVIVIGPGGAGMEGLGDVLQRLSSRSSSGSPLRIVVTGAPGSGKSVALRLAARQSWGSVAEDGLPNYFPVLMTFADYRRNDFDLVRTLTASLQSRGFGTAPGKSEIGSDDFAKERLADGRLLILLDGLDELKLEDRRDAVRALLALTGEHPSLPLIVSCRTVPFREHEAALSSIGLAVVEMAEFIPASIKSFVMRWRFDAPKSGAELMRILTDKAHLRELAKNPLTLTIITFLYSLPKYRLPDNRAQFYEVCARALLEEWDQSQNATRANRFDRPHKEDLLARLAYEHLRGPDPDRDIDERSALSVFAEEMRSLGLNPGENAHVLKEIEHNSGLLVPLAPSGLRFPHQTFLEYFASRYLVGHVSVENLIKDFSEDPRRWREALLLCCGLATKADDTARMVGCALGRNDVELAVEILTNARAVTTQIGDEVLRAASDAVAQQPTPALIHHLGSLATNRQSAFADRAAALVVGCLQQRRDLPDDVLQAVVLELARRPGADATQAITTNFERLQIQRILPAMDENTLLQVIGRLSTESLSTSDRRQIVESLRLAKMGRALYEMMQASTDPEVVHAAAIALARLSKESAVWELLDDAHLPEPKDEPAVRELLSRWGWPEVRPRTAKGRFVVMSLARHVAEGMFDGSYAKFHEEKPELHATLSFLAHGFACEKFYTQLLSDSPSLHQLGRHAPMLGASPAFLRSMWRSGNRWQRWFRICASGVLLVPAIFFALLSVAPPALVAYGRLVKGTTVHMAPTIALPWTVAAFAIFFLSFPIARRMDRRSVHWIYPLLCGPPALPSTLILSPRSAARYAACYSVVFLWDLALCLALMHGESLVFLVLAAGCLISSLLLLNVAGFSPFLPFPNRRLLELRLNLDIDSDA